MPRQLNLCDVQHEDISEPASVRSGRLKPVHSSTISVNLTDFECLSWHKLCLTGLGYVWTGPQETRLELLSVSLPGQPHVLTEGGPRATYNVMLLGQALTSSISRLTFSSIVPWRRR